MTVVDWLRWYFGVSGIVWVEEVGKLSWFQVSVRLFSGAVKRNPAGPSIVERAVWQKIGKPLKRYKCLVCGVYFWSWRKREICHKFSCWRKRG